MEPLFHRLQRRAATEPRALDHFIRMLIASTTFLGSGHSRPDFCATTAPSHRMVNSPMLPASSVARTPSSFWMVAARPAARGR